MSTKIKLLDESTANKIAAGEVVDRPSSVIKELVENAIDAGATKIEVEIMSGGISFMRVTDNGCGMSPADAELAVMRHATSKLKAVTDLNTLSTLGFRGEALPTIASVAKFSLMTRQADSEFATLVEIEGGKRKDLRDAGGNIGTTVKVEDLFFNTPARKKFLKTPVSEGSHINDILVKLAISNPQVAFKFINNNKLVLVTPGSGDLAAVLHSIYGKKVGDEMMPVLFADDEVSISGYLSKPNVVKSSRSWQTYIVNGRVIGSRFIAKAIDNAYHSLLPKAGYPLAVLVVEVPQHTIDVNVHPQKIEMKFADEGRMFKAVYKAVLDAIRTPEPLERVAAPIAQYTKPAYTPVDLPFSGGRSSSQPLRPPMAAGLPPEQAFTQQTTFAEVQRSRAEQYVFPENTVHTVGEETPILAPYERLLPLGQVDQCYIVAQSAKDLYIIDQHAAHERILYDKFAKLAAEIPSQQLLVHVFLEFDEQECALLTAHETLLGSLGFSMEPAGPESMRLKEIPADVPIGESESLVREVLSCLQSLHSPTAAQLRHACLAVTACRAAIKAGDVLNIKQMQILLDALAETDLPYTCPHGRPSIIKFDSGDLAKMFKRT